MVAPKSEIWMSPARPGSIHEPSASGPREEQQHVMRNRQARLIPLVAGLACLGAALPATTAAAEPWGFEQVTPVDKTGAEPAVEITAIPQHDGSGLVYSTTGVMAGQDPASAPYSPLLSATRGLEDWSGTSLEVAIDPSVLPGGAIWSTVAAVSPDQTRTVVVSRRVLAPGGLEGGGLNLYRHDIRTGEYKFIGGTPNSDDYELLLNMGAGNRVTGLVLGGSDNFDRLALQINVNSLTDDTGPHAVGRSYIYQWDEGAGLTLQSRMDGEDGTPLHAITMLNPGSQAPRDANYLSEDGRQLIIASPRIDAVTWMPNPEAGLFVRLDGETTVPISYSRLPGDDTTTRPVIDDQIAASRDGRFIAFHTDQDHRLSPDAPAENGQGFYLYDRDQPEAEQLRFVAAAGGFGSARLISLTDDGRTIYFISNRVLAPGATVWSDNVYVWRDGDLRLVAAGGGWGPDGSVPLRIVFSGHMASPNGRYFAFSASAPVTEGNTSNPVGCTTLPSLAEPQGLCREVYLYDAELDTTVCASCAPDGRRSVGHAGMGTSEMYSSLFQARQLVTDAGEVFFDTPNALLAGDGNGGRDVYSYRDGQHRLVSRATPGTSVRFLALSGDGRSVFMVTDDKLVTQDRDDIDDIYVARAGGGLAGQNPPLPPPPCEGADCREPSAGGSVAETVAASLSFAGAGNVKGTRPGAAPSVSGSRAVRGTAATLRVRVPSAGRISVTGASIRRASVSAGKGGRFRVKVALGAKAKQRLAKRKRLTLKVRVAFKPANGASVARTVTLTFKAPAKKKGGR
jgi:hypothetical protein